MRGKTMIKKTVVLTALILSAVSISIARDKRVNQIPNGSRFSCLNCHTGVGGPRNAFGLMIASGYLSAAGSAGDVLWANALALLDADGDGFSNGTELQDPDGVWRTGDANPGASSLVTNPGDSKSKPVSAVEERDAGSVPGGMKLIGNYPNPFNASTRIRIHLPYGDRLLIKIFDLNGTVVWEQRRTLNSGGDVEMTWE